MHINQNANKPSEVPNKPPTKKVPFSVLDTNVEVAPSLVAAGPQNNENQEPVEKKPVTSAKKRKFGTELKTTESQPSPEIIMKSKPADPHHAAIAPESPNDTSMDAATMNNYQFPGGKRQTDLSSFDEIFSFIKLRNK